MSQKIKDVNGVTFNPDIHSTTNGEPRFKKNGEFWPKGGRPPETEETKKKRKKGRELAKKEEQKNLSVSIHDQLFKAAKQYKFNGRNIDAFRAIADNVLDMAVNPDQTYEVRDQKWAIEQVWDRMYGKAAQKHETDKKITVEVVRDFSDNLPEPKRPAIEGEFEKVDEDLSEVLREIE